MFRLNRGRIIGLLLSTFIIYFLFLSSANTNSEFRKRTEEGLSRRHGILQGELSDEAFRAETNKRLNDILLQKDEKSGQKPLRASDEGAGPAPLNPKPESTSEVEEVEEVTGVAGRKTMQKPKDKPKYPVDKSDEKQESLKKVIPSDEDDKSSKPTKPKAPSDPGKDLAREKLQEYMKKPLIIFSKSYCPHSKRAKQLLLEMYTIIPTPLVVELDQLTERVPRPSSGDDDEDDEDDNPRPQPTLGQKIQELLAEITSRRTVPNIVVGTTSIGGNDLIWAMHEQGTLAAKIKELGGRRIVSVEPVADGSDE